MNPEKNNPDTAPAVNNEEIFSKEMIMELNKRVKSIRTAVNGINKNFEKIAFSLYWIYANRAYRAMGYDSVTDYALSEFDFSRTTAYSFIEIVERFAARSEDGTILDAFDEKYKGYSSSKLSVMTHLSDEQIAEIGIKPDMSVRDIKSLVKNHEKAINPDSSKETLPGSPASALTAETEQQPDAQQALTVNGNELSMPEPEPDDTDDEYDDDGIKGYAADTVYEFSVLDDERAVMKEIKAILKQNKTEREEAFFSLILRYPVREGE